MKYFDYFVLEKFSDLNVVFNGSQHQIISYIQGEHKVFPWLQTFITRKLRGIQKEHMLKCTNVLEKKLHELLH